MRQKNSFARKATDTAVKLLSVVSATVGIVFLVWILWEVIKRGALVLGPTFFTSLPTPPGVPGGGLANAIVGTLAITLIATALGIPLGVFSGVYLSEFGRISTMGKAIRFTLNVLIGMPSIIIGLFVYTLLVLTTGHFSGYAGSVALAIIMLPVIARTTEDMLNLVPNALRESALAIGASRWKLTRDILFRSARSGMITGILLAVARVSGETAPLLFTALNSPFMPRSIAEPTANLTVTIFNYAMSPFPDWQAMAWGASLLIMAFVLSITILVRVISQEKR
jgi:phosphate transport system permease protein